MIKQAVFEDELVAGMQRKLADNSIEEGMQSLVQAADHLNSAVEILEELGLNKKADQILNILSKIAKTDHHISGLTSEKMVANLKEHGTVFNLADDNMVEDILNIDISEEGLEVSEDPEETFEDE